MLARTAVPATRSRLDRLCRAAGDDPTLQVLVVAAHPDDETIGAGARLCQLTRPAIIHVTDGAPRDLRDAHAAGFGGWREYAAARRAEVIGALALAAVPASQLAGAGVADQAASGDLPALTRRLLIQFATQRPDIVLTHPYEGGHPDHDATAFAVHAACRILARGGIVPPSIIEFASYHLRNGALITGEFLPAVRTVRTIALSSAEQARKQRMITCFRTQAATLAGFGTSVERFRRAPRYRFTEPPHAGQLYYEQYDWGVDGSRWRALAGRALEELRLTEPL